MYGKEPGIDERIQASAVHFLLEGKNHDAANVLLSCAIRCVWLGNYSDETIWTDNAYKVIFSSHYGVSTILSKRDHLITTAICTALQAALLNYPPQDKDATPEQDPVIVKISVGAWIINISEGWKEELLEIARGKTVFNQGIATHPSKPPEVWNNLYFRSKSEVHIAEALERAGVLFLPNCRARLTTPDGKRENREPDFLICHEGKWGILEVDGEPWHPPSRTVDDHDRDRLFKTYGIRTVEHYDSKVCYTNSDQVVRGFLEILKRSA